VLVAVSVCASPGRVAEDGLEEGEERGTGSGSRNHDRGLGGFSFSGGEEVLVVVELDRFVKVGRTLGNECRMLIPDDVPGRDRPCRATSTCLMHLVQNERIRVM
jgi:hypothetical protein